MDQHPIQERVVILLITLCWVPCDGPTSHPGKSSNILVTLCWVSCDGPTSHPGKSSNTPSHFMVGTLWWTNIPSSSLCTAACPPQEKIGEGGGRAAVHRLIQERVVILLVTLCWVTCDGPTSHLGAVVILLITLCWVPCDGPTSHPGKSSNTPSHFMLGTLWWTNIPSRKE